MTGREKFLLKASVGQAWCVKLLPEAGGEEMPGTGWQFNAAELPARVVQH